MTAKEFREYAAEHLGWAETASSTKERQIFQQMADAWLEAARLWETLTEPGSSNEATDTPGN